MCNGPPKLHYWACQSASLWLCVAVSALKWFFWHARCWPDSVQHVRARATVSHWQDQYHGILSPRTLNAACLHVKVESIKILTARPALNWPGAVFASRHYNAIRCHAGDWRWQHARTHRRACVHGQGSWRGRNTRGTALGSASGESSGLWQAKYKQITCQSPDWSQLNKYSKI